MLLYGFHQLADVAQERIITVDSDLVISAVQMSQAQHDQEVTQMLALFADDTTDVQRKFKGGIVSRNQPLDENGRPRIIKGKLDYTVGFPLISSGSGVGSNFVTNQKMTVQQFNDAIANMYMGDFIWLRDHILAAMFTNVSYKFDDIDQGEIDVMGLANNDATKYVLRSSDKPAADNHYLAQAAAIADATNPYPGIRTELVEHPENGNEVLCLIASDQVNTTKGLSTFYPVADPNVQNGTAVSQLVGSLGASIPSSARIIGYCDECWIAEWSRMPSGYMLGMSLGGTKPLLRRQDPEQSLQGFRSQGRIEEFPFFQDIWFRRCGFGAWNRTGAVVQRIGNANYAIPASYTSPMP